MKQDSNRSAMQADACQSKNKTIEALTKAMAKVSGMEETVMLVYCHNKQQTTTSAFVGETESLTCGLQVIFDHIAEQRAHPGEMAITRSILEAVAAADLRDKISELKYDFNIRQEERETRLAKSATERLRQTAQCQLDYENAEIQICRAIRDKNGFEQMGFRNQDVKTASDNGMPGVHPPLRLQPLPPPHLRHDCLPKLRAGTTAEDTEDDRNQGGLNYGTTD